MANNLNLPPLPVLSPTKVGPPTSVFGEGTAGGLTYEV